MARRTSVDAYNEIKMSGLLSAKRMEVYSTLFEHGPLTGAQLSVLIKKGKSSVSETVRNRLTELRNAGVVEEVGETICPITGRHVILWDVTKNLPVKFDKPVRYECCHCAGKGYVETRQGVLI